MIQHGRWRLLIPSGRVASDCFSRGLVSEHWHPVAGELVVDQQWGRRFCFQTRLELPLLSDLNWKAVSALQAGDENNPLVQQAVRAVLVALHTRPLLCLDGKRVWCTTFSLKANPAFSCYFNISVSFSGEVLEMAQGFNPGAVQTRQQRYSKERPLDPWPLDVRDHPKPSLFPSCFALAKLPFGNLSWKLLRGCMDSYDWPGLCNLLQGFWILLVVNVILCLNSFSPLHCWVNKGDRIEIQIELPYFALKCRFLRRLVMGNAVCVADRGLSVHIRGPKRIGLSQEGWLLVYLLKVFTKLFLSVVCLFFWSNKANYI